MLILYLYFFSDLIPKVSLEGNLSETKDYKDQRFFADAFPSCDGLLGNDWHYTIHSVFSLNADREDEYILNISNRAATIFKNKLISKTMGNQPTLA